ncbi:MAG: MTH865 family protein [Candidatus Bipolaricaulota bacterium]|nr:MTH865 family protein [Candidatus Bipolaricaulota bacterium]
MTPREELEAQLRNIFGKAKYPVKSVFDLLPVLPQGPMTKFTAGNKSWTAMELSQKLGSHARFPYNDVDSLVKDVLDGLAARGEL